MSNELTDSTINPPVVTSPSQALTAIAVLNTVPFIVIGLFFFIAYGCLTAAQFQSFLTGAGGGIAATVSFAIVIGAVMWSLFTLLSFWMDWLTTTLNLRLRPISFLMLLPTLVLGPFYTFALFGAIAFKKRNKNMLLLSLPGLVAGYCLLYSLLNILAGDYIVSWTYAILTPLACLASAGCLAAMVYHSKAPETNVFSKKSVTIAIALHGVWLIAVVLFWLLAASAEQTFSEDVATLQKSFGKPLTTQALLDDYLHDGQQVTTGNALADDVAKGRRTTTDKRLPSSLGDDVLDLLDQANYSQTAQAALATWHQKNKDYFAAMDAATQGPLFKALGTKTPENLPLAPKTDSKPAEQPTAEAKATEKAAATTEKTADATAQPAETTAATPAAEGIPEYNQLGEILSNIMAWQNAYHARLHALTTEPPEDFAHQAMDIITHMTWISDTAFDDPYFLANGHTIAIENRRLNAIQTLISTGQLNDAQLNSLRELLLKTTPAIWEQRSQRAAWAALAWFIENVQNLNDNATTMQSTASTPFGMLLFGYASPVHFWLVRADARWAFDYYLARREEPFMKLLPLEDDMKFVMSIPATATSANLFLPTRQQFIPLSVKQNAVLVAIAVEQFRLRHGKLPQTLDELVPEILPELPKDIFTDKGFIYRQRTYEFTQELPSQEDNTDGQNPSAEQTDDKAPRRAITFTFPGYRIYSVGWDREDDGGEALVRKDDGTVRQDIAVDIWNWTKAEGHVKELPSK